MSSLLHLGSHCAYGPCRQIDFLPFECDFCHLKYCLDHRSIKQHECPSSNQIIDHPVNQSINHPVNPEVNRSVQTCPVCQKEVFIPADQSINQIVDQHIASNCTTHLMDQAIKQSIKQSKIKTACHKPNCTNPENYQTIKCSKCGYQHCLTHRFPNDHDCSSLTQSNNQPEKHAKGKALMEKLRLEREAKAAKQSNNLPIKPPVKPNNQTTTLQQIRAGMSSINQSISQSISGVTNALGITSPEPESTNQSTNQTNNQTNNQSFATPSAAELRSIKQSAVGDNKIEEPDRIYLRVLLPSNQSDNQKNQCVWLNKKWTVGRALDSTADLCRVKNDNHLTTTTLKLIMTSSNNILPLPYDIPLMLLSPIVQNGSTVALRRISKEQLSPLPRSPSPSNSPSPSPT